MPKPGIINSKVFYIRKSVVEGEISLPVVTFKRQRVGNKVYLRRIVTETLDQIQNASTAQENPKVKVMTSHDVIVDKLNLIKSFDAKILNTLTSEEDIKKILKLATSKGMFKKIF